MDKYFQAALSDFVFETACGGAIRHLADLGYTARQITERLGYPVPYERVREAVTKYFLETGVLLKEEPTRRGQRERFDYVQEHGEYGRPSFRRVPVKEGTVSSEDWTGIRFDRKEDPGEAAEAFRGLLERVAAENGDNAYLSCGFVLPPECVWEGEEGSLVLDGRQREYLQGIAWGREVMYHRLDGRMREILLRLYAADRFTGEVYACRKGQVIHICPGQARDI